jgi:microcystin-dependent protein
MSQPFLGEIRMFAGNYAPRGWQLCNGQLLPLNQYTALFSLLGTTFGGNGINNFQLPDLRGRIPVGEGQGIGLTARTMGEFAGNENVTITTQTMAQHNHQFFVTSAGATLNTTNATSLPAAEIAPATGSFYAVPAGSPPLTLGTLNPASLAANGGSTPHTNLMPALCLSFIIAMSGLYPSRN